MAQTYTWNNVVIMGGGFVSGIETSPVSQGLIYARTDVGGAYRWNDSTSTWTPLTDMFPMSEGNYLGIESIAPDPTNANNVYAAAGMYLTGNGNGVILSSTNQGSSWTVNTIAVPMGGNATGRGMGEKLAVDPNLDSVLFFGSCNNGLWKSTNSAASWTQVTAFPTNGDANYGLSLVVIDGQGGTSGTASATIFVGVAAKAGAGTNLYESTNGGTSWAEVTGGPTGLFPRHASLGSDGNLWVAFGNDYGPYNVTGVTLSGQIWKYNVAGKTWTNVTPTTNWSGNAGNVSVDAENPQHAIISTLDNYAPDKVLATTDGGTAWTVIANPDAGYGGPWSVYNVNGAQYLYFGGTTVGTGPTNWVEALALDPFNANRAFHGSGEGLFVSTNIEAASQPAGVTWTFDDSGLEETVPLWVPSSVNFSATYGFLSAVGDVSGTRNTSLTAPSASGMYSNPVFGNCNSLDFAESNPNDFVRVGNSSTTTSDVAYSTNNGQTWTPWGSAPPGYGTSNEMQSVAVGATGAAIVVSPFSGYGSPAYATSLGGAWTTCTGLPSGAIVASDRSNASTFYATSGGTLYKSTNSGASFASVNTFTGSGAPRPCFGEPGEVWVAANGGNLYRFTNGGSTETQITNVTAAYGVGFGMADAGQTHPAVFIIGTVGGQYGFYRCDDGVGTTWTRINDNTHQFGWLQGDYIGGDENTYGRCYLTTGGRGVIYGSLVAGGATSTPTGTSTATRTNTPASTPTSTPTATRTNSPTNTATSTASRTATSTPTNTVANTATSTATKTSTPTNTQTSSPTSSATASPSATATKTASSTATNTVANTATATSTSTPTASSTATRTNTATTTSTATSTVTPTATRTNTATSTSSATPTNTVANTLTSTPSNTTTATASDTASKTTTATSTNTLANTATQTATSTPTSTLVNTATSTSTATASDTASKTTTATPTDTLSDTATPTATSTSTSTLVDTATSTPTATASDTASKTTTATPTDTLANTATPTGTSTPTSTLVNTVTSTSTATASDTASKTTTATPTDTLADTATPTATSTSTDTLVNTATSTATATASDTASRTTTATPTDTLANTATSTATSTPTSTLVNTATSTSTATASDTASKTTTATPTDTLANTATPTATSTPTSTLVNTATSTSTATASDTASKTTTATPTDTLANTATPTATSTPTNSLTNTATNTTTPTDTYTATSTATATPTKTLVNTVTNTATSTASNTVTPTTTPTNTLTKTTTPTIIMTPTNTFVNTATPTVTPSGNKGVVIYPNPVTGPSVNVLPPAYSGISNVEVEIFTIAFRMVQVEAFPNVPSGVAVTVELTDKSGSPLANGIYYVVVIVDGHHSVGKLLVLR